MRTSFLAHVEIRTIRNISLVVALFLLLIITGRYLLTRNTTYKHALQDQSNIALAANASSTDLVLYTKSIPHIFLHSLIIYPNEAMADPAHRSLF
jgi:hypothetical protein